MYKYKSICVIVPAYNEASQIGKVIETMPEFIDRIVIVDDASTDNTAEVVQHFQENYNKIVLISLETNEGVGGALATGYKWAVENNFDVAVRMDGDGQMNPHNLEELLDPVV